VSGANRKTSKVVWTEQVTDVRGVNSSTMCSEPKYGQWAHPSNDDDDDDDDA